MSAIVAAKPQESMVLDCRVALNLPDVSNVEEHLAAVEPAALVSAIVALEAQLEAATAAFSAACQQHVEVIAKARALVRRAIADNGGKALAHDTFDVRVEQATRREKRIDVLRQLEGVLPDDLYRKAVFIDTISVEHADQDGIDAVLAAGGAPKWTANLVTLDKYARDFGGRVAEIVEEGSPRVEIGGSKLIIEPRKSALKAAR